MKNECFSCHARVVWVVTEKARKLMPIDPEPVLGGNLIVKDRTETPPVVKYVKPHDKIKRFVSHFATCPKAAQHRKKQ